jgi:ribosomal protein S18 acetylase RimI-like enzyme
MASGRSNPHYAGPVQTAASVAELPMRDFLANIDSLLAIYGAAMGAQPEELAARRAIMERHVGNPAFRAVAATDSQRRLVAFTYGFHGGPGQWWHDVVRSAVTSQAGTAATAAWLSDSYEIAEVHVQPDHQARGIGRRMMLTLTGGRPERTAVLSTRDAQSRARRLYRSLGFVDLLTAFHFPGGGPPYAVMGAPLPLPEPPLPGPPLPGPPLQDPLPPG